MVLAPVNQRDRIVTDYQDGLPLFVDSPGLGRCFYCLGETEAVLVLTVPYEYVRNHLSVVGLENQPAISRNQALASKFYMGGDTP